MTKPPPRSLCTLCREAFGNQATHLEECKVILQLREKYGLPQSPKSSAMTPLSSRHPEQEATKTPPQLGSDDSEWAHRTTQLWEALLLAGKIAADEENEIEQAARELVSLTISAATAAAEKEEAEVKVLDEKVKDAEQALLLAVRMAVEKEREEEEQKRVAASILCGYKP